eukprot:Rhum_TRINITY_DN14773_c14_g1::Rhum_TRINITY_DN14773_c14_g1_i1::g.117339::m.117339
MCGAQQKDDNRNSTQSLDNILVQQASHREGAGARLYPPVSSFFEPRRADSCHPPLSVPVFYFLFNSFVHSFFYSSASSCVDLQSALVAITREILRHDKGNHLLHNIGVRPRHIVLLERVCHQVVQLERGGVRLARLHALRVRARRHQPLPVALTHAVSRRASASGLVAGRPCALPGEVHVLVRRLRVSQEGGHDADSVETLRQRRRVDAGELGKGRHRVPKGPLELRGPVGLDLPGPARDRRRPHAALEERALVAVQPARRVEEGDLVPARDVRAVVRREEDDRVVVDVQRLQLPHEVADVVVHVRDRRGVIPLHLRPRGVRVLEVRRHRLPGLAPAVRVPAHVRHGEGDVQEERRAGGAVRRRLRGGGGGVEEAQGILLEEVDGVVVARRVRHAGGARARVLAVQGERDVGGVGGARLRVDLRGVHVVARNLRDLADEAVEPLRGRRHQGVDFARGTGGVARPLQDLRGRRHVEGHGQRRAGVAVLLELPGVAAGEERGAAGTAHGVARVRLRELDALLRQLVDVRRCDAAVRGLRGEAANLTPPEVVGHDPDDVRPRCGGVGCGRRSQQRCCRCGDERPHL